MILPKGGILPDTAKRIVSLVPSQTELLHWLGLEDETIAITKFCVHPDNWFQSKTRVGGTKALDIEKIIELQPDLIIANKEENVREQVDSLAEHFPVYVSDISNMEEALDMIRTIGELTGRQEKADSLVKEISNAFTDLQSIPIEPIPAAYFIWKDPYMTVGGDTFIHAMMEAAGFRNVFGELDRYPELTMEQIRSSGCEYILLSSEPYPFGEKHVAELLKELPDTRIICVDGEMFSWYGNRLIHAAGYFKELMADIRAHNFR